MTLALGLAVAFIGGAFLISGYSDRPIGRLLFGYWDAPGASAAVVPPGKAAPGNALSGGVHAPGVDPVGAAHGVAP